MHVHVDLAFCVLISKTLSSRLTSHQIEQNTILIFGTALGTCATAMKSVRMIEVVCPRGEILLAYASMEVAKSAIECLCIKS